MELNAVMLVLIWKYMYVLSSTFLVLIIQSSTAFGSNCSGNNRMATGDTRRLLELGVLCTIREQLHKNPAYYLGAIPYAIEGINKGMLCHEDFKLGFWAEDIMGDVKNSLRVMTTRKNHTIAFLGPEKNCYVETYYAAAWNKPLITYNCRNATLPDSSIFTSFARTTSTISKYIISLLQHFHWRRFTLIYQDTDKWRGAADTLQKDCDLLDMDILQKVNFDGHYIPTLKSKEQIMRGILMDTHKKTRMYIFLGEYDALIDFARNMYNMGLVEGYVVIALKDNVHNRNEPFEHYTHFNHPGTQIDQWMVECMKVVLLLQPVQHHSRKYKAFINSSAQFSMKPPFNVPGLPHSVYQIDYTKPKTAVYAAYLYDAINLLAMAIKDTLLNGGDIYNGTEITSRIKRESYTSILGDEVLFTENGHTQHIYSLHSLKTDHNALYGKRFQSVGNFSQPGKNGKVIFYENHASRIEWIGDKPPPNEPKCGFDGSKCHWPVAISCVVSASVIIIAFVFGCRHYIYEQKLARLLWKIEYMDLLVAEPDSDPLLSDKLKFKYYGELNYCKSFSKGSIMKDPAVMTKSAFRTLASYKGSLVVVKGYRRSHVEINRAVKKELHYMREMSCDNINMFIGACLDQPIVCVVSQYCTRGSLKDILENDDLPLDEMFTASLIFDLIRGMIYLHDSEVVWHGNLTPSNCLVDSRWVLQVADFGLHFIRSSELPTGANSAQLLYRAPELLRRRCLPAQGTQKGDVYSFAIILHEIHSKSGPWGNCATSVADILDRVLAIPSEPSDAYRPSMELLDCDDYLIRCMEECWYEDPDMRPEFKNVRIRLKPMQKGLRSNIFDNIMEKYTTTLEGLVQQRTQQLEEERKKTEVLLHRMLPKSVADQLKRGEMVQPELYEMVTIYFSDIVGFTALSAESTPLQVVNLLNDLYTMFDDVIEEYDVYKVETIGDAYMVASGLPIRNGNNHAGEVASMSLHLLRAINDFKIKHQPTQTLKLRIGIHSGPCVAGVVGMKMPRYCLFGDTVNTASRMETTGVALKIHCSPQTKAILDLFGGYELEERGFILIKGKGEMFTYFLMCENSSHRLRRNSLLEKQSYTNNNLLQFNVCNPNGSGSARSVFELDNECSVLPITNGRTLGRKGPTQSTESLT